MSDRVLFPLMGVLAGLMIALALVWPKGLGARSPGPFGHKPVQQTPAAKAADDQAKAPPPVLTMAPELPTSSSRSGR